MAKMEKIEGLSGHVIVCGCGRVGGKVCEILEKNKLQYVVMERDKRVVGSLAARGANVIEGDATMSLNLRLAGIAKAKSLVAALDSDANNLFVLLTARELNKNLRIAARAFSEDAVSKMHRAGASVVVLPEVMGGLRLGHELVRRKREFDVGKVGE